MARDPARLHPALFCCASQRLRSRGSRNRLYHPIGITSARAARRRCHHSKVAVSRRIFQMGTLSAFAVFGAVDARADSCPTAKDPIATDRPDVTNSSLVVPFGSLQSENGINLSERDGGRAIDGTNTRWRLGVAPCLEFLVDVPSYTGNIHGPGSSGFSDVAPAVKWQVSPIPGKF